VGYPVAPNTRTRQVVMAEIMNRTRGTILALSAIAASVTIYMNSLVLMPLLLFDLIITIEAVVIAELILYEILKASEETKLTIKLRAKKDKIGFSVESENRTIKDAYPVFDETRYQWEDESGTLHKATDLYVGAKPACFYPLIGTPIQQEGVLHIVLTEVRKKREISFHDHESKDISIRIVGEGNETKRNYRLISFYPSTSEDWESLHSQSPELFGASLDLVEKKKRK